MKKLSLVLIFVIQFVVNPQTMSSQNINEIGNVDNMSDSEVSSFWGKAQKNGLTLDQLEKVAKTKGISADQISKFKQRISGISVSSTKEEDNTIEDIEQANVTKFGHTSPKSKSTKRSDRFGMDFFSNPNISFMPNLNLATPETYQLGPGDVILIDIWGAAENKYNTKVGTDGNVRIPSVGPINVSGLSISDAKKKIVTYLRKIYTGIGASNSSYNKVFVDVSLSNVRTVQVNIIGEVKVPGTYSLNALSSVLNALYAAGGPTINGTFRKIKIFREGKLLDEFDVYKYLTEGNLDGNVTVRDRDIIIVSTSDNVVFVSGQVKRPGIYEIKEGETLKDLISYFSGFTSIAYKDRLSLERVAGNQREILEIQLEDNENFILKNGDKLSVGSILNSFKNRVTINGAVVRPGDFELTEGLTVEDIIIKAQGVTSNAFLERGVIFRTIDGVNREIIPFSVKEILNKTTQIQLKREDIVQIFTKEGLKEEYTVSINGAINNPQTIPFIEKLQIEDFIAISGGFKEGADVSIIDISRRINDKEIETISKSIRLSTDDKLTLNNEEVFYLKPFDIVSVRYKKGYTTQKNVSIQGEVNYPGSYPVLNKEEKISDLLDKAGGVTKYAYVEGATLIRASQLINKGQSEVLNNLNEKQEEVTNIKKRTSKIGINLEKIIEDKNSKFNLILEQGDVLIIPSQKQTIEIKGEVLSPSVVRYDKSKSLKDYVNNAGGFSEEAKKGKTYVVYANGEIKSTKRFLFFKSYPKLEPGAFIFVPKKSKVRDPLSVRELLGITTSITTLGILLNSLIK